MVWHSSAYFSSECFICGATPWYRVGPRAFCRKHKSFAERLRQAAAIEREIESASARRDIDAASRARDAAADHHKAASRRRRK